MDKKNETIIAFSEKAEAALIDIEKKYNLEESDEEWTKKLKENKPFNRFILANLCRKLFSEKLSEENFINSLKRDLKIDNNVAKKIFQESQENIVPFLIGTSEDEIEKGVFLNSDIKSQQVAPILPVRLIKNEKPTKTNIIEIDPEILTDEEDTAKIKKTKKIIEKKSDTYREPI